MTRGRQFLAMLRWERAARATGVGAQLRLLSSAIEHGTPRALHVRLAPGSAQSDLVGKAEVLAAVYGCARVEIIGDRLRSDRCLVLLYDTNVPRPCRFPVPEPQMRLLPPAATEPLPLGHDDRGATVYLPLFGESGGTTTLIGGVPGTGKSMAIRVLLASLVQTRSAIVVIDPTGGAEASRWQGRLAGIVCSAEAQPTIDTLQRIIDLIKVRGEIIGAGGETSLLVPVVLICDELAELAAAGSPKQQDEARSMLRRIVALGRKANVACILATQRTTATSIDVTTRSLAAWRLALAHPDDPHGSEALLGPGNRQASRLTKRDVGAAFLTDGGQPTLLRVFELPAEHVPAIAEPHMRIALDEVEWLDSVALRELTT